MERAKWKSYWHWCRFVRTEWLKYTHNQIEPEKKRNIFDLSGPIWFFYSIVCHYLLLWIIIIVICLAQTRSQQSLLAVLVCASVRPIPFVQHATVVCVLLRSQVDGHSHRWRIFVSFASALIIITRSVKWPNASISSGEWEWLNNGHATSTTLTTTTAYTLPFHMNGKCPKIEADRSRFIAKILTGLGKFFFPSAHTHMCMLSVYRFVLTHFRFICIIASFHRMALSLTP